MILITGAHKAFALHKAIEEGVNHMWTVSAFQQHPSTIFLCDEPATNELRVRTVKYFKGLMKVHNRLVEDPDTAVWDTLVFTQSWSGQHKGKGGGGERRERSNDWVRLQVRESEMCHGVSATDRLLVQCTSAWGLNAALDFGEMRQEIEICMEVDCFIFWWHYIYLCIHIDWGLENEDLVLNKSTGLQWSVQRKAVCCMAFSSHYTALEHLVYIQDYQCYLMISSHFCTARRFSCLKLSVGGGFYCLSAFGSVIWLCSGSSYYYTYRGSLWQGVVERG